MGSFKQQMIEKQNQFHERVKAAFVLKQSLNHWGRISDSDLRWLKCAFPGSSVSAGNDQGATYITITPNFSTHAQD